MLRSPFRSAIALALVVALGAFAAPGADAAPIVYTQSGAAAADIQATVDAFRAALGDPVNGNTPGPLPMGRREINWDGGAVPFDFPGNFFNVNVPRGAEFTTPGTGFRVSNGGGDTEFDSINPTYPAAFTTFSSPRLFSAFNSTIVDAHFFVPGSDSAATVSGFGAVFTDVDTVGSTTIDYYDAADKLLASIVVPTGPQGLSFAGAAFDVDRVFRVRITSGNTALGPDDDPAGGADVVVMDDFIYGEPQAREAEFCKNPTPTSNCTVNGARGMPCVGTDGDDDIRGSNGPDVIVGGDGADRIRAGRGDDIVCGGPGDDDIRGGSGNDQIGGEEDDDRLRGERGDDVLAGGPGNDDVSGGVGDDVVVGNDGEDDVRGERGDDEVDGGLGTDDLDGGKDDDNCTDPDGAQTKSCE